MTKVLPHKEQTYSFDSMENSIWNVIITMTTIGYGDFVPKTTLGRAIIVILTIWGAFVISIMVVVLNNALGSKYNTFYRILDSYCLFVEKWMHKKSVHYYY